MPAEPGADIGIISAFSVCMAYCSSTFTSSIRSMNRGSRCPIVGRPSAPPVFAVASGGPGPSGCGWWMEGAEGHYATRKIIAGSGRV